MAEKAAELTIVFRARNLMKNALDKVGKQLNEKLALVRKFQNEIRAVSKAALAVGVIGGALFTGAIVQAAGFEKALSNVTAVTNANIADQKRLRDAALEMGSKSVFAASQAAEAQLFLGQSGQSTREIIASLPSVLKLAAAGQVDLGFAAEFSAATLKQFSLDATESSRVANVFAAASSNSLADLNKLAFALRQAGPDAAAFDQSLEGTVATISSFIDLGLRGEQAGTVFRAALVGLAKPSSEAQEILDRLGITIFDTSGKMLPFVDIVEQLEKANLSTIDSLTIFGTEAGGKMAKLIKRGADALREMEKNITGTDEAARQAAERTDNLTGSITFLTSALEGASISVGSEYIPVIRAATDLLTEFISGFNALDPATKAWIANIALGLTAIIGFMGALGLLVVSLAASKLALGVLALSFGALMLIVGKAGLAFALFFAVLTFVKQFAAMKNVAVAFFEFFERGWLGLAVVFNGVIAAFALGLQATFRVLRATILKPLDLIFEALKKIKKSIDINPFDVIEDGLSAFQSHTEEVVGNVVGGLNKVTQEYNDIHDAINKASEVQEVLKEANDKTTKTIKAQEKAVSQLKDAHVKLFEKAVVLPAALKDAFELTGLVSTADVVQEMDALVKATGLLLDSGKLTLEQERELIAIFTEKANAITGVTKRLDKMTEAAGEYNSAIDRLLSVRLNSLQGDLEKTFGGIVDPDSIKKKVKEAEKILIAFSNNTQGANGETLKQIQGGGLVDTDVLADYRKRVADGEKVMLSFKKTNEGMVTSIKNTADGYGALTFSMGAAETKIGDLKGTLRTHQDELDNLFNGPIAAQLKYIDKLNESGASIDQIAQAENRLKDIQMSRITGMLGAEEAFFDNVKKLRQANLKDIEDNNKKIQALGEARASTAEFIKNIEIRRQETGLSAEEKKSNELGRLQREFLFNVPGLSVDDQAQALDRIAQKANQLSFALKEGSRDYTIALDLAEQAAKKLAALQEFQQSQALGKGFEEDAKRFETAAASSKEAIDGFTEKFKLLESEIANANLTMAVEMLDNATGPGEEIKKSLEALFSTPITQEIIIQQTFAAPSFSGGGSKADSFFDDGIEFQTASKDASGFGDGVVSTFVPDSFASGIRYIQKNALVRVHQGETILSRTDADRHREGDLSGRGVTFNGDIIVQVANSTEAPQVTAERLREEINKLNDLDRG